MRTVLSRWGNSLAVRLPKEAAASAGLREGAPIELTVEDEAIVLRRRRWDIAELVSAIRSEDAPVLPDDAPKGSEEW